MNMKFKKEMKIQKIVTNNLMLKNILISWKTVASHIMLSINKTFSTSQNKKWPTFITWLTNARCKISSKWTGSSKLGLATMLIKLFGNNVHFISFLVYYKEEQQCFHAMKKLNIQELAYLYAYCTICLESIFEKGSFKRNKDKPAPLFMT